MRRKSIFRLYACTIGALGLLAASAGPSYAQFPTRSVTEPVLGERYYVEGGIGFWSPGTVMAISSEQLGIPGDIIDFKDDLGLTDQSFREIRLLFRAATRHKFRYQYNPVKFEQSATVTREIIFQGQRFVVGVPVTSGIDWRTHRFGYEFDFISRSRGFGGFILEVKQTDVQAFLESPRVVRESVHAAAPVPAIGGIFRAYVTPNVSISGEITGVRLPEGLIKDSKAHYIDMNFYGTYNFTRNLGAQIGFRRLDLGYTFERDFGDFELKGLHFGLVARY